MYECKECKEVIEKRSTKDVDAEKDKSGPKSSDINKSIALAMFTTAISPTSMSNFCSEVGIVHPTNSTMLRNNKTLKRDLLDLSEKQLKANRKEHVKFVRSQPEYEGDIEVFENGVNGKKIKIARGTIAIDGAGGTRAYNHLIKGHQHCQIVYSLDTMKPLMVVSDQVSCYNCSRQ